MLQVTPPEKPGLGQSCRGGLASKEESQVLAQDNAIPGAFRGMGRQKKGGFVIPVLATSNSGNQNSKGSERKWECSEQSCKSQGSSKISEHLALQEAKE